MNQSKVTKLPFSSTPRLALFSVLVILIFGYLILTFHALYIPDYFLIVLALCASVYAFAELATPPETWSGYHNFAYLTAGLAVGGPTGLGVIAIGAALAVTLRAIFGVRTKPAQGSLTVTLWRAAASTATLLLTYVIYVALGGGFPPSDLAQNTIPLVFMLLSAALIQPAAAWLLLRMSARKDDFAWVDSHSIVPETFLLLLTAILPAGLYQLGIFFFVTVIVMVLLQELRSHQIRETRRQLVERVSELSMANSLRHRVTENLVLDDLLSIIHEEVSQRIPFSTFFIALYDDYTNTLDFRLVVEQAQRSTWGTRVVGGEPVDYVIQSKQPLLIRASESARLQKLGLKFAESTSGVFLGMPLALGEKLVGAMGIYQNTDENAFGAAEMNTLRLIAEQVALSIRNAVLYDRSRRMAEALSFINGSVQNVMFNLDSSRGMETACDTALKIASAQKAAIYLLDLGNKRQLRLTQHIGMSEEFVRAYEVLPFEAEHYHNGAHVAANTHDAPAYLEMSRVGGFRAFAQIPLRSVSTVIGFLAVYHDQPHYYRKTELDLLETLAYQITAALDNAELLKALETYASEQAQLVYLSRISTASLDLDKVILSISSLLEQILNADGVQIGILVPGKDRLNLYRAHQESLNVQALRLNNVPELHALNAEPLTVLPHIYYSDDPQVSIGLRAIMREYSDTTLVVMPLVVNNALFGVVLLGNQERRVFNDSDLRLIEMAMNQITAQLYNAQQYTRTEEDLQRRLEQLALLENLAQQITSSLEPNKVIDKVLDAAITATQADVATLGLLTDSDEFWFIRRERNSQGEWVQDYEVIPKDKGVSGRVVRTGEMTIIPDNRLEPDYYPVSPRQVYLSSLTVPLRKENRLIGVLNIESVQLDFFTPQHAGFIGNLAGHAVISIDNARQMEERQHEIEMLTRLRELSLRATTASDIESVATAVLQTSFSMLNAQDAALFSYNMNTDEITLLAGVRYDQNQRVELHETLIRGKLAYRIARDGNMDFIQDLRQYPPYEFVDTREYISLLGIPVKRARQICEVLCLAFTAPQDFERRERSSLDLLSIQAASHLENALLNGEIRSASNRMRAILDSTRDGVILLDGDGVLIDYNPSAERLLGITLDDEQPSRRLAEMLMTQSTAGEMGEGGYSPTEIATLARILKEEPDRITRRQFARYVQGQFTYIEEIGSPVKDSNNVTIGRLLVLRDVTEEKMLEAYRDEITHMIVHDLRSPLGSIISALTLAMESVGEPDTAYMVAPTLEVSLTSAYKLLRLVDSLLDIAKLETRQMPLKFGPGKVDKMVTEAYITLSSSILAANLTVDIEVSPDLPPVYVDTDKITRVVINLLDNAIRYAPVNGRILIHAQFLEQRKRILVQIADSGIGIPPEERERVFDKFATQVQKGKGPERGPKGSGLGLTFCKLAIEAHGERIWVESESPLSGACFAFTLPIVTESATNPTPTPTAEVQS